MHKFKKIPNIENWSSNCFKDISVLFEECISSLYFPDISSWNTDNINI